jgi:hypothetical protein
MNKQPLFYLFFDMAASPVDDVLDEEKIPKALGIFD